MKHFYLLIAALICTPLLAQNPADLHKNLNPQQEFESRKQMAEQELREHMAQQQRMSQQKLQKPQAKVQADDPAFLCDSLVKYNSNGTRTYKEVYTYDEKGRTTSTVTYDYTKNTGVVWEGEQSCGGWDGSSLRFSDYEGYLPTLSDETYNQMVGKTMHLDIKDVNGPGTTIRVTTGWWSPNFVEDTEVHAGETFSFEFTQEMASQCMKGGEGRDLLFVSNNGLTITKFYFDVDPATINDPTSKVEYLYDDSGYEIGRMEYKWVNGDWNLYSYYYSYRTEYLYDDNGNQIGSIGYRWENGEWIPASKSESLFDDNGRYFGYVSYDLQNGEWVASFKNEFTFDANGNVIISERYDCVNGEWVSTFKTENTYDEYGRQIMQVTYYLSGEEWVNSYKYECAYDENDRQIMSASYYWSDGEWVGSWRSDYTFDDNGRQTSYTGFRWVNGAWVNSYKDEYAYDAEGNQILYAYYYYDADGEISSANKYEYTYDDHGNRNLETYYSWVDGAWVVRYYSEWKFTYDAEGREIEWVGSMDWCYGEGMQYTGREVIAYDDNGNVISNIQYGWNAQYEEWYETLMKVYTYDEHNNLTKEALFHWNDNTWNPGEYTLYYYSQLGADGLDEIEAIVPNSAPRKVMVDGKILIIKDGHIYNVQGQLMK